MGELSFRERVRETRDKVLYGDGSSYGEPLSNLRRRSERYSSANRHSMGRRADIEPDLNL